MKATLAAAFLCLLPLAMPAQAHDFHFHPALSKLPVSQRAADQRLIIRHDRTVLRATSWLRAMPPDVARFWFSDAARVRRFHAAQLVWTRRELRESERLLDGGTRGSSASSGGWSSGVATWYGPGFYGHGPACPGNGALTEGSMWVASMTLGCGTRVTICDRGCVRSWVADTGNFSVTFDLAPGAAAAIGGHYTHTSIRWRFGWS